MKTKASLELACVVVVIWAAAAAGDAQQGRAPSVDANGAPIFKVDPFWPKPLPNRWSMQQVTGIHVDHEDHIWFLNRAAAAEGAQGPGIIAQRPEWAEAMAIGAEQVGEEIAVAVIALGRGRRVAGARGLHHVRVDRHDLDTGLHQGVDDHARGAFDGDLHGLRRAELAEPTDQLGQAFGRVRHRAAPPRNARPRRQRCAHARWRWLHPT